MRIAMVSILGAVCLVSACGAGDRSAVRTSTVVRTVVAPATASRTSPQPARTSRPAVPTSRGSHTSPVVSVPGGNEVLMWGSPDRVTVWRWQQGAAAWQPQSSLDTSATGDETLTATGDVVSGSSDATFVIAGPFGGDGGVGYVGVTRSAAGWGVLSSADPPATRLTVAVGGRDTSGVQAMGFGTGELATDVPNSFFPLSDQDEYPLETFWRFTGSAFVRDRTTQFRAEDAADPDDGAVELPVSCPELPADGRYFVAGVDLARRPSVVGAGQGITLSFPTIGSGGAPCGVTVSAETPLSVPVRDATRWMTAPLWMLPWIYDHEDADLGVDLPTDDDPNAAYVGTADEGVDRLIGPGEGARFVITVHAGTVTAVGYG